MIALEMAAPDPADIDEPPLPDEASLAEPPPRRARDDRGDAGAGGRASSPAAADSTTAASASLGSALIANGIVRRPTASATDPLAPIRRMSQAERIAFFS